LNRHNALLYKTKFTLLLNKFYSFLKIEVVLLDEPFAVGSGKADKDAISTPVQGLQPR